jgi:hypothetical protein
MRKIDEGTKRAIASYTGPVLRYAPGVAMERASKPPQGKAARWLSEHRNDVPVKNTAAVRKHARNERHKWVRVRERNDAILKRIAKQER